MDRPETRDDTDSIWSGMKRRINLQLIGAYIRDGGRKTFVSNASFQKREEDAYTALQALLRKSCGEDADRLLDQVTAYACVIQEIYFNLGMKAGAILHGKLTDNFETDI